MRRAPAIEALNLHKEFAIPRGRDRSIRHPAGLIHTAHRKLTVLAGVSFEVARGEYFGVVGRNGSGKSTLLKLVAGIYKPDAGSVRVEGRLGPVLDLGVGFNPELATRENAVINGVMLGLSRKEARKRVDGVLEFAELEDFAEARLKNLSSGMRGRLAFATMLETDPDVLLVDEILAVGDQRFQERCTEAMESVHRRGKTIVLVTHSMTAIERLCDRALLLEGGEVEALGNPNEVAARYREVNAGPPGERIAGAADAEWPARLTGVRLGSANEAARTTLEKGAPVRLSGGLVTEKPLTGAAARVEIRAERGVRIFVSSDMPLSPPDERIPPGGPRGIDVEVENRLVPGAYVAIVSILRATRDGRTVPAAEPASVHFNVPGRAPRPAGLVSLEHRATLQRATEVAA